MATETAGDRFKWACLGFCVLVVLGFGWMVNDLRTEFEEAAETVNANLPELLAKSRETADTVAILAQDLRQVRELAGATDVARDKSLVAYADKLLDAVQESGGVVGVEKVFGTDLKKTVPAEEWVVGARKEAVILLLHARSRREVREHLCQTKLGFAWYIQVGDNEPVTMEQYVQEKLGPDETESAGS